MGNPVYLVELTALAWPRLLRDGGVGIGEGTAVRERTRVVVNATKTYRATFVCRGGADADGQLFVGVQLFTSAGAIDSDIAISGGTPGTAWTTYTFLFGAGTGAPFPGTAATMAPSLHLSFGAAGFAQDNYMECREAWIEDTASPGVALSADRYMRSDYEWEVYAGLPPVFYSPPADMVQTLTLRYATGRYCTTATDTPPLTQYDPRVVQPGLLRMEIPSLQGGGITTSHGQIVLDNSDGELNELVSFGFDGQSFVLRRGQDDAALSTFTEVMRGTMQQATVDHRQAVIRLIGRDALFDKPFWNTRFLGNNVPPNGLEGDVTLAGKQKPLVLGTVYGIDPPCVNKSRNIYLLSTSVVAPSDVRVAGVALTAGAAYTSQADMEANAPAAGTYRVWTDGAAATYFRIPTPNGVVTCSASEPILPSSPIWWPILYRMAQGAGVAAGEFQTAISTSPPTPYYWPAGASYPNDVPAVGLWLTDGTGLTYRQAMDRIARSVGAWYGFVHWGGTPGATMKFGAEVLSGAGNTPSYDQTSVLQLRAVADPGEGRGLPAWRVEVRFRQNVRPLAPADAPAVNPQDLGPLGQETLALTVEDGAVLAKAPGARAVSFQTWCADDPAVTVPAEAARRLRVLRYAAAWYEVTLALDAVLDGAHKPRLGGLLQLTWPTALFVTLDGVRTATATFHVMSIELNLARAQMVLLLRQVT